MDAYLDTSPDHLNVNIVEYLIPYYEIDTMQYSIVAQLFLYVNIDIGKLLSILTISLLTEA